MTEPSTTAAVAGRTEEQVRSSIADIIMELAPNPDGIEGQGGTRLVEDLGFHSLALLELAFTLEDEFDLPPIDETTAQKISTIDAISEHVLSNLRASGELVG
jgi:acyl carrier protein